MNQQVIDVPDIVSEALHDLMLEDTNTFLMGLGVTDPKRVFGTTSKLLETFGSSRVIETPTAENAMTGVAVGLCLAGNRVITVHQRLDFFLLAMDQLVNSAAKWDFMFGHQSPINLTVRLIVGRGWGQGPTHSQNLQSWFAHIPGLKVVSLSLGQDVYGVIQAAVREPSPVLIIEDRWVHHQRVIKGAHKSAVELGKARLVSSGSDISLVTSGFYVLECISVVRALRKIGISVELIDLRSLKPIDYETIISSLKKTGRLVVLESSNGIASIGSDIISKVVIGSMELLKSSPVHISYPDKPEPTSKELVRNFIPRANDIASIICQSLGLALPSHISESLQPLYIDSPNEDFRGPF